MAGGEGGGGEADGFGLVDEVLLRAAEPGVELGEGGGGELRAGEGGPRVLGGLGGGEGAGGGDCGEGGEGWLVIWLLEARLGRRGVGTD